MAKKNNDPVLRERIDWLAVAIGNLGNITGTARKLGVTEKLICDWLDKGLESVPFGMVAKLSEKGDVPLVNLAKRLGPWTGAWPPDPKKLLAEE